MEELALWPRLFLTWVPPLALIGAAGRWRGPGLLAALGLSLGLFLLVCALQGEAWSPGWSIDASSNPAVQAAFTGAFWAWALSVPAGGILFAAWCRRKMRP
jgi:hypothetical protein